MKESSLITIQRNPTLPSHAGSKGEKADCKTTRLHDIPYKNTLSTILHSSRTICYTTFWLMYNWSHDRVMCISSKHNNTPTHIHPCSISPFSSPFLTISFCLSRLRTCRCTAWKARLEGGFCLGQISESLFPCVWFREGQDLMNFTNKKVTCFVLPLKHSCQAWRLQRG